MTVRKGMGGWAVTCDFPSCRVGVHVHDPVFPMEDPRAHAWCSDGKRHWCPSHSGCASASLARFDASARAAARSVFLTGYETGDVLLAQAGGFMLVAHGKGVEPIVISWPADGASSSFLGASKWSAVARLARVTGQDRASLAQHVCGPDRRRGSVRMSADLFCECGMVLRNRRGLAAHLIGKEHLDRMKCCDWCGILKKNTDADEAWRTTPSGLNVCGGCASNDPRRLRDSVMVPARSCGETEYVPVIGGGGHADG